MTEPERQNDFFTAIIMGDLDGVKAVVPKHPEALGWVTPGGYPPLHMAIMNRRAEIAIYLVEHGAEPDVVAMGSTASVLADTKGMGEKLRDAVLRREEVRTQAIESEMRRGLEKRAGVLKTIQLRPKDPS